MPPPQTTIYLYFVGIRTTSGVFQRQIRLTSRGVWCYAENRGPAESGVQLAGTRKNQNGNYERATTPVSRLVSKHNIT